MHGGETIIPAAERAISIGYATGFGYRVLNRIAHSAAGIIDSREGDQVHLDLPMHSKTDNVTKRRFL